MKQKILEKAGEMFLKLGYKSVTMDDIAKELGISKKTLYKLFSNKQSLVEQSTMQINQYCLNVIDRVTSQGYNPIKENLAIKDVFKEMFNNLNNSPLFQLRKYYPKIHEKVIQTEVVAFSECIRNNIEKGIQNKLYRDDLNIDVCVDFYLSIVFSIHDKDISHSEVLRLEHEALLYHIRAISTQKGLGELEKQLENTYK